MTARLGPALLTLALLLSTASALECYFGTGDSYQPISCDTTCDGIACLCYKLPSENNGAVHRGCWANPHNAQTPGCYEVYYKGEYLHMCTCQGDLCNGAHLGKGVSLMMIAIGLVLSTLL